MACYNSYMIYMFSMLLSVLIKREPYRMESGSLFNTKQ